MAVIYLSSGDYGAFFLDLLHFLFSLSEVISNAATCYVPFISNMSLMPLLSLKLATYEAENQDFSFAKKVHFKLMYLSY